MKRVERRCARMACETTEHRPALRTAEKTAAVNAAEPRYSMFIERSPEDQGYIVSIPELPCARSRADTYKAAAEQGQCLIEEWIQIALDEG